MTLVDASHTPDQLPDESRDSEAGSAKIPVAPSFFAGLVGWIRFIVAIPRLIVGLRADHNALTAAFSTKTQQDIQLAASVHELSRRLEYYEQHVPRMRELARQYEQEKMGIRKPSNGQKLIALS